MPAGLPVVRYDPVQVMRSAINIVGIAIFASGLYAQSTRDAIRSFAGKEVILIRRGGEAKVKLDRAKLDRLSGSCDVAVAVRTADLDKGKARFLLELIGTPQLTSGPRNVCPRVQPNTEVEIAGFAENETADQVGASMRQLLQTPEEYLAASGITFDLPPAPDDEAVAAPPPPITHPNLLLRIEGTYSEQARRSRVGGQVTIRLTVGTDGRVHNPRVVKGLGSGLDENALRTLGMWRFEPGRQGDRVVASKATIQMNFQIY